MGKWNPIPRIEGLRTNSPIRFCVSRNKFQACDLVPQQWGLRDVELVMNSRIDSSFELIDHKTCRSICDAVGERLQRDLPARPELPPYLAQLMDELRRRDRDGRPH